MKAVLVKVDDAFKQEMNIFCATNGVSKKALIVNAVREYIRK
jgi:predicted transcriptional regulator